MKSLVLKGSNIVPFVAAAFVSASATFIGFGFYHGVFHISGNTTHCHADGICHNHWFNLIVMKKIIITALVSSVVSVVTWESLHIVYHIDEPKAAETQKTK